MKKRISVVVLVPALLLTLLITVGFATVGIAQADSHFSTSQKAMVQQLKPRSPSICYQAHVQNIGWQDFVCDGEVAGTTGQSLRMEAIRIILVNAPRHMSVCYRAHVQNIGWQPFVCNGRVAGTTGQSLRMEAIQIVLFNAHHRFAVCYQAHVQNIGWQPFVCNGRVAGTTGQSLRMEAIRIILVRRR